MYEEEDDDLPSQYRRLTAHLQTNSTAFNQRLAAYLTGQIGVRSAVDQYLSSSYAQQQFPNAQQFPHPGPMYQNPGMAQQSHQQMMQQSNSPNSMYRQAPYPMPNMHQRAAAMHGRSASIANPQMTSNKTQSPVLPEDKKRRMSLASTLVTTGSPDLTRTPVSDTSKAPKTIPTTPQTSFSQQQTSQPFQPQYNSSNFNPDISLFTTALPAESQMLLRSALDPRDPMTNMFMAGSQYLPNSYYQFGSTLPPTFSVGKDVSCGQLYPSFDGLNATLAPSELEMNLAGLDFQYAGQTSFFDAGMKETTESGTGTPGGTGDFNLFIDQESWGESAPSSQS
jgi:hypothetical protein